jgi:hypothetical protein
MPFGDRTGPAGMGPMTGRAAGFCAGYPTPGYANPAFGRGYFGRGRGFWGQGGGWGRRNWFWGAANWNATGYGIPTYPTAPTITAQQELDELKNQAQYLQQNLEGIQKRIEELEAQKSNNE